LANRNLTPDELAKANALLGRISSEIAGLAGDDADLRFAYTRKIGKELTYFERGKPMLRRKLKREKLEKQNGRCAICNADLPTSYNVLGPVSL